MKRRAPFDCARKLALPTVLCLALLAGCGRNDVRVYSVPKENPEIETAADAQPHLHWKLPQGWEEREGDQMRVARFAARGTDGQGAEVSIIPLGGFGQQGGSKDQLLNIWREQLKLAPLTSNEVANSAIPVTIGSGQGELYEMVSEEPIMENRKARTLVALLHADDGLWIFKMTGHTDFVEKQKPEFASFLKSISIDKSAATPVPRIASASTNAKRVPSSEDAEGIRKPNWTVPANWKEQPPSQMLLGKFVVQDDSGRVAEVTVSAFPGDVGGLLANVNRWRGQVGLKDLQQADLTKNIAAIDLGGTKATLVDIIGVNPKDGKKTRIIGAVVPHEGKTWFFKLMGDEQVAEKEKQTFVKFVQTTQFPDA
jgi:hypothetical protein